MSVGSRAPVRGAGPAALKPDGVAPGTGLCGGIPAWPGLCQHQIAGPAASRRDGRREQVLVLREAVERLGRDDPDVDVQAAAMQAHLDLDWSEMIRRQADGDRLRGGSKGGALDGCRGRGGGRSGAGRASWFGLSQGAGQRLQGSRHLRDRRADRRLAGGHRRGEWIGCANEDGRAVGSIVRSAGTRARGADRRLVWRDRRGLLRRFAGPIGRHCDVPARRGNDGRGGCRGNGRSCRRVREDGCRDDGCDHAVVQHGGRLRPGRSCCAGARSGRLE